MKPIVIAQEDTIEEREKKRKLAKKELINHNVNEREEPSKKEVNKGHKKKVVQVKKIDKIREENNTRIASEKEVKMKEKLSKIMKHKEKEKVTLLFNPVTHLRN